MSEEQTTAIQEQEINTAREAEIDWNKPDRLDLLAERVDVLEVMVKALDYWKMEKHK